MRRKQEIIDDKILIFHILRRSTTAELHVHVQCACYQLKGNTHT
jgi:hypothetical protein